MSRKLVTVRTVSNITPIEGADRIECLHIDGWTVVGKKGEFKKGDPCVFFEIDSFLPADDERWSFLAATPQKDENGVDRIRLRTVKLRGQISQGLALPVHLFPEVEYATWETSDDYVDFSEVLNVTKWERPEPGGSGVSGSTFPPFVRKTDEERIQNLWNRWREKYEDVVFIPTLKLDGSSCTVAACDNTVPGYFAFDTEDCEGNPLYAGGVDDLDVYVCSRRQTLPPHLNSHFWKAVHRGDLVNKVSQMSTNLHRPLAVQGEVMGPGIQGNRERFSDYEFFAFNIFDILAGEYLPYEEASLLFNEYDIQQVPIIDEPFEVFKEFRELNDLLEYAEGPSINSKVREGVVFKSVGLDVPVSFKAIANNFLLGGGD